MIVCPNCTHQNPDGATQCEACYTPLPAMSSCPNCGASVQTDATFCGQCGHDLRPGVSASKEAQANASEESLPPTAVSFPQVPATVAMPSLDPPEPLVEPEPLRSSTGLPNTGEPVGSAPEPTVAAPPESASSLPVTSQAQSSTPPAPAPAPPMSTPAVGGTSKTQLQQQTAKLLHIQTDTELELPQHLSVIHLGKPNDRVPPDIDVSGFPHSEVVSRVHADIRVEGDGFYLEDVGSANGTYVNNFPLASGNRHRLRPGDRIALGKGDMVTFLFQIS